jgi:hypothetical protein
MHDCRSEINEFPEKIAYVRREPGRQGPMYFANAGWHAARIVVARLSTNHTNRYACSVEGGDVEVVTMIAGGRKVVGEELNTLERFI